MADTPNVPPAPLETPPTPAVAPAAATPPAPRSGQQGEHRPFRKGQAPGGPRADRPPQPAKPKFDAPPPIREFGQNKPNKRELDASIEAEMAAALAGLNVENDLGSEDTKKAPHASTPHDGKKRGTVTGIRGPDVFVEMQGNKTPGVLDLLQFEGKTPKIGEVVEFVIEKYDTANGILILNKQGAAQSVANWSGIKDGMIVEVKVTGVNKGGLEVEVSGIRAFMPMGQIDMGRVEQPETLINSKMNAMVVECNPQERNLVVSRKALMEQERQLKAEEFWQTVQEGQTLKGTVRNIKPFGAFVDLGGADGLIPVSELSWSRVGDPNDVLKLGQAVEVRVQRVDHEARKIALSLKALHGNPWDEFGNQVRPGTRLKGTVTRIMDFGAFVELQPGIEGLVHVSELSNQRVRKVRDVVNEGQQVEVQVLTVDPQNRRIGLSLKAIAAQADWEKEEAEEAAAEQEAEADKKAAEERMANRKKSGNLRGGIGGGGLIFTTTDDV
ncbi:MAG TPA: S1 RNA-binding domain-containing protein [Fimbriiglobus sp.]|jgi:small subunit ribosomal protein S1